MLDPSLTLKEGPKVKFNLIKRFAGHITPRFSLTFQTSKTSSKQILGPLKMVQPNLTLKER